MIYKCTICGHIHNEESTGIVLKNFDKCPICGQSISNFVKVENSESSENQQDSDLSYNKEHAKSVRYDDPDIGIDWTNGGKIEILEDMLSEKNRNAKWLKEIR